MTRERWAMVLLVALVLGCLVVMLNATPKAQGPAVHPGYAVAAVAADPDQRVVVVIVNQATGQIHVQNH